MDDWERRLPTRGKPALDVEEGGEGLMAGRPPLEIGTYGEIADPWQTPSGKWQTKARYRGGDGVTRP
ncbi:hypothetical protein MMAGJ_77990 [Mycolicibacterium mageritense]|uniref:Uncharacterized protein n=1 Tax=Mycolicibacterium mageritense TaxID=53462 RepID=A0ABN5YMI9_MYCME|nr:hypothetical protein MMAGJ_77990 [Mycolicibacterium mageritense]